MTNKVTWVDERIDPCPFCGSKSIKVITETPTEFEFYAVKCMSCFARGPLCISGLFALLNWNKKYEAT